MKQHTKIFRSVSVITLTLMLLISSCATPQPQPTLVAVSTDTPQANMPNPASAFCVQQGFKSEIRTAADGSQSGVCIFPDGNECDEWAYYRGECGPSVSPPTPKLVQAPLAMQPASVPIPYAILINTGDQRGITAYDRSGLVLGEWQTGPMTVKIHTAGPITDGVMSTPLLSWDFDSETLALRLTLNMGENTTPLRELADSDAVYLTDMIGLPASPVVAYSTMHYEENGALIHSEIHMAEYQSLASVPPILVIDSRESEYITPLAIRAADQKPVGIWFTYHKYGIGGTPALFTNNSGLYYFDIPSNTIYEFLAADKTFADLSVNQAYAAWVNANSGDMQVTDLINGQTVSFPKRPESEDSAGFGMISPSGSYIAWAEGINLTPGEKAPIVTVRIGTIDGNILVEYPHVNFSKTSELGMETSITLLGWLSDETLLVSVHQNGREGASVILTLNVNANEIRLFARGEFAGFAYP